MAAAGLLDLDDLLHHAVHLLQSNDAIRDQHRCTLQHLLVDEFQDTVCHVVDRGDRLYISIHRQIDVSIHRHISYDCIYLLMPFPADRPGDPHAAPALPRCMPFSLTHPLTHSVSVLRVRRHLLLPACHCTECLSVPAGQAAGWFHCGAVCGWRQQAGTHTHTHGTNSGSAPALCVPRKTHVLDVYAALPYPRPTAPTPSH